MALAPSPAKTALLLGITLAFILLALWSLRRLMGQ
jgi:flagellar biogenesis protein FliO